MAGAALSQGQVQIARQSRRLHDVRRFRGRRSGAVSFRVDR